MIRIISGKQQATSFQATGFRLLACALGTCNSSLQLSGNKLPSNRLQAARLRAWRFTYCLPLVACGFTFCLLACHLSLAAAFAAEPPEKVYVVNDYRYVPVNDIDDRDAGLSLCGTRCNALTTDYLNITDVGGWQLMKGEVNKEVTVELNNPFIKGQCICVADEYLVKIDDRYSEERRRPKKQK